MIYKDNQPVENRNSIESNLYWELGDTLGYYIHRVLTDDLEYVFTIQLMLQDFLVWKFQPQMFHLLVI